MHPYYILYNEKQFTVRFTVDAAEFVRIALNTVRAAWCRTLKSAARWWRTRNSEAVYMYIQLTIRHIVV